MYCEICDSRDHFKPRCSKYRVVKQGVVLCGFAVEGLGFFHISHDLGGRTGPDARAALIRVTEGKLSVQNVVAELKRLIPGDWVWNVEEAGQNSFRTFFPSKNEMLRMVECGVVHSKFQNAKIQIEERLEDAEVKYVLLKAWVQFTGLPPHLRGYLVIWVVGSIL
jgi:hypothetical protein